MKILINEEQLKNILKSEIEMDEVVGVPDNIYETAKEIFNKFIEKLP